MVHAWISDPEVRRAAFSSDPIELAEHLSWWQHKLTVSDTELWIAESDGAAIAQLRVELAVDTASLSIVVASEARGRGYGRQLLIEFANDVRKRHPQRRIEAFVRCDNERSFRAFVSAGFREAERMTIKEIDAVRMVLDPQKGATE